MNAFQKFCLVVGGPIIGSIFIYMSYLMLTDVPPKETLLWLHSADVTETLYLEGNGEVSRIRFFTSSGYCLSVNHNKEGFSSLLNAAEDGKQFSIGYNMERELFSDSPQRYTVIYEILADGEVVKSYEKHIKMLKYIFWGVGIMGLFMLGSAIYYGILGFPPARQQSQ